MSDFINEIVAKQTQSNMLYKIDITLIDGMKNVYIKERIGNYIVVFDYDKNANLNSLIIDLKDIVEIKCYYLDIEDTKR